jgi:hypothetical protein
MYYIFLGDQARGAMKSFMEGLGKPNDGDGGGGSKAGLWASIKSKNDMSSQNPRSSGNFQPRSNFVNNNNNESMGVLSPNNDNQNRVRNTRNGGGGNKTGGFSNSGGGKFKPKVGGRRKQLDREDRPRDSYNETIPPMLANALFDMEHFATYAGKGKQIPEKGMDDIDKFLANIFIESFKTESHEVRTVVESPKLRRVLIPRARPLSSLIESMQPKIYEANEYGSLGYNLGSEAWEVVSKNYYYSENERHYICNGIARLGDKIMTKLEKEIDVPVDMVFDQTFRKGYLGIEDERRRRLLADEIPVSDSDYIQSETNWKQEAFIDEDQL